MSVSSSNTLGGIYRKDKKTRKIEKMAMAQVVQQMIDEQTTILAYKTYSEISMKKDMIK